MKEGGGGSTLSAYCPFSPFSLAHNEFCTVYRAVRNKGWEEGRGGEDEVRMGGNLCSLMSL